MWNLNTIVVGERSNGLARAIFIRHDHKFNDVPEPEDGPEYIQET